MKAVFILGCLAAIASLAVAAQSSGRGYGAAGMEGTGGSAFGQETTLTAMPRSLCAAGVRAQHLADGEMMKTGVARPKGHGQRLHLAITSPNFRTISSATVNLRGWDHTAFATTSGSQAAQAVRTETVKFVGVQGRTASADVWAPGLNSVTAIDLVTIFFTDGSSWQPARGHACRTAPDGFMLVSK